MWYARDGKQTADEAAMSAREEIERVKKEEEEAMRVTHFLFEPHPNALTFFLQASQYFQTIR